MSVDSTTPYSKSNPSSKSSRKTTSISKEKSGKPPLIAGDYVFKEYEVVEDDEYFYVVITQAELMRARESLGRAFLFNLFAMTKLFTGSDFVRVVIGLNTFHFPIDFWGIDKHDNHLTLKLPKEKGRVKKDPEEVLIDLDKELGL